MEQRVSTGRPNPARSSFIRQSVWITLPVVCLVLFGLRMLFKDHLSAQQEVAHQARRIADRMASNASLELHKIIELYLDAHGAFRRLMLHELVPDPTLNQGEIERLRGLVAEWNREHPDIILEGQPQPEITLRDHQLADPPFYPAQPQPPAWFLEMDEETLQLWHTAAQTTRADPSVKAAQWQAVIDQTTHRSAKACAQLELLFLNFPPQPLGTWIEGIRDFSKACGTWASESGLTLGSKILGRRFAMLGSVPDPAFFHDLAHHVLHAPDAISKTLLDLGVRKAVTLEGSSAQTMAAVLRPFQMAQTTRRVFDHPVDIAGSEPREDASWHSDGSRFFLLWNPNRRPATSQSPEPVSALRTVQVLPGSLIRSAIDQARVILGSEIPAHFTLNVQAAGRVLSPISTTVAFPDMSRAPSEPQNPLAEARVRWIEPGGPPDAAFAVAVFLNDPQALFNQVRNRSLLFACLVLGAAAAALLGLWNARRAFERQHQLSELKSDFVSSVSHELRAPLASVRLMAESLRLGKITDPTRQQEYYGMIDSECRRLGSLIENVLDFARIERGHKHYEFAPVELESLVRETVRLMEPYAAAREVSLSLRIDSENLDAGAPPEWDGRAVHQALLNLIDNAAKHSQPGQTVDIRVSATSRDPGHRIQITVEDRGPGIPSEDHQRIFEPFFRRGSELRRDTQGAGIGLAIVRHVAEAHGGRVLVESSPGAGSRFTLDLPASPPPSSISQFSILNS